MHHHVVGLESVHVPYPEFEVQPPDTIKFTNYVSTRPEELKERIRDATIIICTTIKLTAEILDPAVTPNLKAIAAMATGTDHVDLEAAKSRGIVVFNYPGANLSSVSEHAVSLYFAARRKIVTMHNLTVHQPSEWKATGSIARYLRVSKGDVPLTASLETCGILGYGALGKRIEKLMRALGMKVLIADRKGATGGPRKDDAVLRTAFTEVLKNSTVLVIVCPRTPETVNLISEPELSLMRHDSVIINVSRGSIVDEAAVVEALRTGSIHGYATDVFAVEPAEGAQDSPLLAPEARDLNITVSPHVVWVAQETLINLQKILKGNVEAYIAGAPQDVV